jgi:tRNA(Ile)-lysidine synthetase-like protein
MKNQLVKHIINKDLINNNEPVVIALSGGVDSMVLFDIISHITTNIIIAHVNHNKRDESIDEYNYIKQLAEERKFIFEGYTIQSHEYSNFHQDARLKRYTFFRAIAQKYNATKIVVAHHLDDQVETVLMRIVRGTSFQGYSGIKDIRLDRNVSIIRPLMDITKKQILDYAQEKKIKYFEDSSNSEDVYTRNRFRHHIIPALKEENPNLDNKIIQLAEYIDGADELLEDAKKAFLKEFSMYTNVHLEEFNKLNKVVKIKVLEHIINTTTENTVEVSYDQYKSMIELCYSKTPNQEYSLGKDYVFVKEYEVIYVTKLEPITPINIKIDHLGEYFVSDNKSFIFTDNKLTHNVSNYFELCYNELVFPLHIRHRKNGDKMALKVGTKKVKDILIDKKVPKSKRDRLLLITNETEILWIPGVKKSHQDNTLSNKLYIYEVE